MDINALIQRLQARGITLSPDMMARLQQWAAMQAQRQDMRPDMMQRPDLMARDPSMQKPMDMQGYQGQRNPWSNGPFMSPPGAMPPNFQGGPTQMPPQGLPNTQFPMQGGFNGSLGAGGGQKGAGRGMNTGPSNNMMPMNYRGF